MAAPRANISIEKSSSPRSLLSSPARIFALRSGATNRPFFAMQIGTISIRSFGAALATDRADRIDTSCSALRPPKRRMVRVGMGGEFTGRSGFVISRFTSPLLLPVPQSPQHRRPERLQHFCRNRVQRAADLEHHRQTRDLVAALDLP